MKKEESNIDFENKAFKDGFKPSEAYLNELEASLFETLDIEEEFGSKSSGLDADNAYFSKLEKDILTKVGQEGDSKLKSLSYFSKLKTNKIWYAAASVLIIIATIYMLPERSSDADISFSSLTQEEHQWYIQEKMLFLTEEELSLILDEEAFNIEIEDENLDEGLEDYLLKYEVFSNEIY